MVKFKKKKNVKQRGHKTHGWGAKKKHRGAGNRGGRGMAGTGKRGDAKKPSIWKEKYFGIGGFHKHGQKEDIHLINISSIDEATDKLVAEGKMTKQGDTYSIDVSKLGANKVLGSGAVTKKLIVTSKYFSESAVKKIEAAGGKAVAAKKDELKEVSEKKVAVKEDAVKKAAVKKA